MTTLKEPVSLKEQYALRKKEHEQKKLLEVRQLIELKAVSVDNLTSAQIDNLVESVYQLDTFVESMKSIMPSLIESYQKPEAILLGAIKGKETGFNIEEAWLHYASLVEFFGRTLPKILDESKAFESVRKNPNKPLSGFPESKALMLQLEAAWNLVTEGDLVNGQIVSAEFMKLSCAQLKEFLVRAPKKNITFVLSEVHIQQLAKDILSEAQISQANIPALVATLDKVGNVVNGLPDSFGNTKKEFQAFKGRFQKAAQGGLRALNTDPRLIAQANLVANMFSQLGKLWPNIEKLFGNVLAAADGAGNLENDPDTAKKLNGMKTAITKQLGGGILAKIGRLFGAGKVIYPGNLTPATIANDLVNVLLASTGRQMPAAPGGVPPTAGPTTEGRLKETKKRLAEDLEDLRIAMKSLAAVPPPPPPPPPAPAPAPQGTAGGQAAAVGGQPGAAVPGQAPAGGGAGAHPNSPEMRKALSAFISPDKLDAALAALTKAVTA